MKKSKLFIALSMLFGLGLVGCGSKKSEPTPPAPTYTAEKVVEDFNDNEYGITAEWDEEYQEYGTAVNFGESDDESETNLGSAAYTLGSLLPEYMVVDFEIYGDPTSEDYYDIFGDGSYYYYLEYISSDELSLAVVISYVYSNLLIAQISIVDNA